ncbi:DUF4012 domain-containing protein [Patescibacteria group bacterium]|nr:DUF4012 domain-containing protein [Patescibacteria group bacterium]
MKVGLRPKKFFHDIVVLPQEEIKRQEFEIKNHRKNKLQIRKPLVLDALIPEDLVKKRVSLLWPGKKERLERFKDKKRLQTIEEAAESVLCHKTQIEPRPLKKIRAKTFIKNSLLLFLKLSFVALMVYNACSLYFEKNWLTEKINNLSLASKVHIVKAEEALANFDRKGSAQELDKAGIKLLAIKEELLNQGEYNYLLPSHPLLSNELSQGQNILELGILLKDTSRDLNLTLDSLMQAEARGSLLDRTDDLRIVLKKIKKRVDRADAILKTDPKIKEALGFETGGKIDNIISQSKEEISKINQALELMPLILGERGDNRYLVLFMNNAEMRPGGGFPGNYGVVSFADNNFESIYINDIYYLQWLKRDKFAELDNDPLAAAGLPTDLYLSKPISEIVGGGYALFSSNWSLDFRDNAKRAVYLYKNVYEQEEAAGVIGLTPNLVEDILGIIGPVKMDDYSIELNQENFREIIEYKVEFDNPFKTEGRREINPKQVLADFGPKFMEKINGADLSQKIKILQAALDNLKEKQILLYHTDPKVQALISELDASGEIKDSPGDFLSIFHFNINGQKNGQQLERRAKFSSEVNQLGFAKNELNLTVLLNENNPRPLHQRDRSYLEVVVPLGSRIREAKMEGRDFVGEVDYFQEAGHTVFGFWLELDPGEAKNIVLKYQAPIAGYSDSLYSLNLFKQPGANAIEFEGEIKFEDSSKYGSQPRTIKELIDSDKTIKF